MRGIYSSVTDIRRQVFTEVARMAYEGGDYSRVEELPYKILPGEVSKYRDSIFLERAIVGERLRLSMGLPLRPIDEHAPLGRTQKAVHQLHQRRFAAAGVADEADKAVIGHSQRDIVERLRFFQPAFAIYIGYIF